MCQFQVVFGVICSINLVIGFLHSYESPFEYLAKKLNEVVMLATFDSTKVNTSWFEQPLSHFNPKDNRTWKMRYFERHDLWKLGKPIYLYLGGEGAADPVFLKSGIMYDLAKETNGALYLAEHRYYGESKPFKNFTSDNLEFLSSRQALADFANLLKYIKASPKFESSKVVVVGGSYSGNLAAWMKLIYPDLVDAAIASSAPVLAKVDFYEYLETVSDDFQQYGSPGCWEKIAEKFAYYEKAFQTKEGIEALKKKENICDSCDMNKQLNKELFFFVKIILYMSLAQYAYNPIDYREFCDANFTSKFRNMMDPGLTWNEKYECQCFDFDNYVYNIAHTDLWLAWVYQTCTEFGYFQTSSSKTQPFRGITTEFYYNTCTEIFGSDFNETRVKAGVQETNIRYGGLKPNVTNVVFVNGDMDPWSRLSILEDLNYKAPAKVISEASHCMDLFPNLDGDSEELKEARAYIKYLIKVWTGEDEYKKTWNMHKH